MSLGRALVGSYLSLPVDTDDARCGLMWCSDKDGLPTDAVHVDAGARLQVVQVNVPIFGNKENNIVLGAHLPKKRYTYILISTYTHTHTDRHMKYTVSPSSSLDRQITHCII